MKFKKINLYVRTIAALKAVQVVYWFWYMIRSIFVDMGNHLFKNGKALMFMGIFFDGLEAKKWLEKGLKIVGGELDEQVYGMSAHREGNVIDLGLHSSRWWMPAAG